MDRATVIGYIDTASDKLSTQFRAVTFAVLGIIWLSLGSKEHDGTHALQLAASNSPLILIGGLCIAAMLLDAAQYAALYFQARNLLDKMERERSDDGSFAKKSVLRRFQIFAFYTKLVLALIAVLWLLVLVFFAADHGVSSGQ